MRLIKTTGSDRDDWIPCLRTHRGQPYAILSHRWAEDANHEVLFADIEEIDECVTNAQFSKVSPGLRGKPAFAKLKGAAQHAQKAGYNYLWADTCCIDKNSSAELTEAINSMWSWYKSSKFCIVYLADVQNVSGELLKTSFAASQWWKRGWTLQELLAPSELTFYSREWSVLGEKKFMDLTISKVTGIDANIINGTLPLSSVCIAQRMSWASSRVTTRPEDIAYCLLGIFGVNMPLLYGEGDTAFVRLQEEIMKGSDDETIFAWRDDSLSPHTYSGLLAVRPSAFDRSRSVIRYDNSDGRDLYTKTNKGLALSSRQLFVVNPDPDVYIASFHCANPPTRQKIICIYLKKISEKGEQYTRIRCGEWATKPDERCVRLTPPTIYVKRFPDQQPMHSELDPSKNRIRLMQIIPSENSSIIKVRLMEADIRTSRYTAISQHWAEDSPTRTIWVNDEPFQIREGAFRYLQKACEELSDDLFWMFSVCVQLGDDRERSHHVTLYTEIYTYASKVVAWLGTVHTDYNQLRQLLAAVMTTDPDDQIYSAYLAPSDRVRDTFTTNTSALENIASHPYWRRAWIVQEILSAREVVIDLDTFSITIEELTCIYHVIAYKVGRTHKTHMGRLLDSYQHRKPSSVTDYCLLNHKSSMASKSYYRLEDLLETFQSQICADVRDRTYAFANLSELKQRLQFDYEKSPFEIFIDAAACLADNLTLNAVSRLAAALGLDVDLLETQISRALGGDHDDNQPHPDLCHSFEYSPCLNLGTRLSNRTTSMQVRTFAMISSHIDTTNLIGLHAKDRKYGIVFGHGQQKNKSIYRPVCLYRDAGHHHCLCFKFSSELRQAFRQTIAIVNGDGNALQIVADRIGLLALGLCAQVNRKNIPEYLIP